MTPSAGDIIANRFRLIRELGRGSMGLVWLAYHLTLEVRCAVKFIVDEAVRDPRYRAQFHLEARAIAQVRSPHVVRVLDHDVCDDVPYIAMEFLEGEDLGARLQRVGRLDPYATYRIVSQVAHGLGKAHAAGVVHRDLKPENVFLAREDDEEVVKLLDFGIAKLDSVGGQAGGLVGTPEYMSPEQTRGVHEVDHRSDLWSLAVIAYQCLTGRLPFEASTLPELFARIMVQSPPLPSEVVEDLPPDIDWWWARGASRNPEGRFQSARELANAFGEALRMVEAGAKDTEPPGAALVALTSICHAPRATPPAKHVSIGPGGAPMWRWRAGRVPIAATGLIATVSAGLVIAARSGTSVARADLVDRRPHTDTVTVAMPQPAAEGRERVDVAAPAEAVDASTAPAAKRAVAAERAVTPALRPRSVVAPRREEPSSQPLPSKEETEVDFGI